MNPDQNLSNLNTGTGPQSNLFGTDSIFGAQPVTGADQITAPGSTGQPTKDSIEKASELVAALYMPPMSNPLLIPPDQNLAIAIGQLGMDKICLNILDSWSKNLQEIGEQIKEEELKKETNPVLKDVHATAALFLAVATIFVRAIFGSQIAALLNPGDDLSDNKVIANKFASQLNQWAQEGTLNGYLLTIVDQLPSTANLSEAQKTILAKQMEVIVLSSALAGLYKAQTDWITSEEFNYSNT